MSQRFNVCITDFLSDELDVEHRILGDIADVHALNANTEDDLQGRIEQADAIMMYHNVSVTRRTIESLRHCKLIVRCGVGVDNVDWKAARAKGIAVGNVPDYGTEEVADSAIGMMLTMVRGISLFNSRLRAAQGPWMYTQAAPLARLRGRVLSLVGLGRVGTAAALRGKAFGMDVVFYDPYVLDGYDKSLGIRRAESVAELLSQAYVLSLHCPLTEETRHLVNAESLELMPRGSFLVNTARGAIVDTAAIPAAIRSGRLAGAAIDVLDGEPPRDDQPLVAAWRDPKNPCHDRVLVNPHAAFYSEEGLADMRIKGSEACRRALLGLPLRNVVN